MAAKKAKRSRGRPSAYRGEFPELARKYCLLGATNADLGRMFEVATSTIGKWIAETPEFSDAVKEGREQADAKVAASLFHRATGYSHAAVKIFMVDETVTEVINGERIVTETKRERYVPYTEHYPPDTAAAFIWLKNRRPDLWRDKIDHEHHTPLRSLSDEKLDAALAAVEQALKGRDDLDHKPNGARPTLQ